MGRRPLDQYETPDHYIQALLAAIGKVKGQVIYEPCAGTGCISQELERQGATVFTNDIDPTVKADTYLDARDRGGAAWGTLGYDWIITNPPFNDALPILAAALRWGQKVAFLARLSFLEPTRNRAAFWAAHAPTGLIVLPRYSFRNNDLGKRQTDSVTCCWLIFEEGKPPCLSVPH